MNEIFESGLNILRREARDIPADDWKSYEDLMRRVQQHVEHCGYSWFAYESPLSKEFADLMKL